MIEGLPYAIHVETRALLLASTADRVDEVGKLIDMKAMTL
jgi:hypothetical protein